MDRFIVISSDCHAGLPGAQYREYLDPQYRAAFDVALPIQIETTRRVEKNFLIQEINDEWRKDIQQELTGAWDYAERVKMLDKDGIAGEVVFPDGITEMNSPPFGVSLNPPVKGNVVPAELIWAGARAHNRWLAEFCQMNPARHHGVAIVPVLWSVEEAVKEVLWMAKHGLRSAMIPTVVGDFDGYNHKKYDPFWAVCQEHGIIINFHSGAAPYDDFFGKTWPEVDPGCVSGMGVSTCEHFFWTYRPIVFMIWGGVFERFPKLKAIVTEVGGGGLSLLALLQQMDRSYFDAAIMSKLGDFKSHLSMAPTEYFRRNVGIGASCISRADVDMRNQIGVPQIMWGSDYPHPEGTWPQTHKMVYDAFVGIPEADIAAMLGENAIKFFGFEHDKMAAIAARIGPKKSEFVA